MVTGAWAVSQCGLCWETPSLYFVWLIHSSPSFQLWWTPSSFQPYLIPPVSNAYTLCSEDSYLYPGLHLLPPRAEAEPVYSQQRPVWMIGPGHRAQLTTSPGLEASPGRSSQGTSDSGQAALHQHCPAEVDSEKLSKMLKGNMWSDGGCITAKAHRGTSLRKLFQKYSPFSFHELKSRTCPVTK